MKSTKADRDIIEITTQVLDSFSELQKLKYCDTLGSSDVYRKFY